MSTLEKRGEKQVKEDIKRQRAVVKGPASFREMSREKRGTNIHIHNLV